MPLSHEELDDLSDQLAFARPDLCVVLRPTEVRNVGGAKVKTFAPTGEAISCRVEAQNRVVQEGVIGGRVSPVVNYVISLPRGTEIGPDYRVLKDGITLEIAGVPGLETFAAEVMVPAIQVSDAVFA